MKLVARLYYYFHRLPVLVLWQWQVGGHVAQQKLAFLDFLVALRHTK
jgi:hypothetical protein